MASRLFSLVKYAANSATSVVRRIQAGGHSVLFVAHGNPNVTPEPLPVYREWVPVIVRPVSPPVREVPFLSQGIFVAKA